MEQRKVSRLNTLFEKMVSNSANVVERRELNSLYEEYIDDGRENPRIKPSYRSRRKVTFN